MKLVRALAILILAALTIPTAFAQSYPSKPLKIIVSTSAGGVTDLAARILRRLAGLRAHDTRDLFAIQPYQLRGSTIAAMRSRALAS